MLGTAPHPDLTIISRCVKVHICEACSSLCDSDHSFDVAAIAAYFSFSMFSTTLVISILLPSNLYRTISKSAIFAQHRTNPLCALTQSRQARMPHPQLLRNP